MLHFILLQTTLFELLVLTSTRYLLVQIEKELSFKKAVSLQQNVITSDSRGLRGKYIYDHIVYLGDFPIKIEFSTTEKEKCKNPELKSMGTFSIIWDLEDEIYNRFQAISSDDDKKVMAYVRSEAPGKCDDVKTFEEYQGCGLAKYLVATCFQDEKVLGAHSKGIDVEKNNDWKKAGAQQTNVANFCETVTFLRCKPRDGPGPCITYLRAGSAAGFDLLFVKNLHEETGYLKVFKLGEDLEKKFKAESSDFVSVNGKYWFFCKCKENEKKQCLDMQR